MNEKVKERPAEEPVDRNIGRSEAAADIRASLRRRSGRDWSVTCGHGTVWGWLTINAPPRRRPDGASSMLPEDQAELARLLGFENVHHQGALVCPEDRAEYVFRARHGRAPAAGGAW